MNKSTKNNQKSKAKLGVILKEADLVSASQVKMALEYQIKYPCLRLGEILSVQGWIDSRTCDFFASKWDKLVELDYRKPLGYYFLEAGLLEKSDIQLILSEQQDIQDRFGKIAIKRGYLKPSTVDFFLKYLFPDELGSSSARTLDSLIKSRQRRYSYYLELIKRNNQANQNLKL